jgi:hypothetical protein
MVDVRASYAVQPRVLSLLSGLRKRAEELGNIDKANFHKRQRIAYMYHRSMRKIHLMAKAWKEQHA